MTIAAGAATVGRLRPAPRDCNLTVDFGYRYAGANGLAGTICTESGTLNGYCGDTATTYSGVGAGESPLAGVVVIALPLERRRRQQRPGTRRRRARRRRHLHAARQRRDRRQRRLRLRERARTRSSSCSASSTRQNLRLDDDRTPTRSVEGGGAAPALRGDAPPTGPTVTVLARQALNLAGRHAVDVDFAFDVSLGGDAHLRLRRPARHLRHGRAGHPDYDATLLASNGARHAIGGGPARRAVTSETDGPDSPARRPATRRRRRHAPATRLGRRRRGGRAWRSTRPSALARRLDRLQRRRRLHRRRRAGRSTRPSRPPVTP